METNWKSVFLGIFIFFDLLILLPWLREQIFVLDKSHRGNHTILQKSISCDLIFHGYQSEIQKALKLSSTRAQQLKMREQKLRSDSLKCGQLTQDYRLQSASAEEAGFPIAYSILIFNELSQFERLLRAIYRPEHFFCVHVDSKSPPEFFNSVRKIISCFNNVNLAPRRVDVKWGTFTVLEADLICMDALLKFSKKWKYFINLTGQEFPLRTNLELVRILKAMNGSNLMEGTVKRRNKDRIPSVLPFPGMTWTKGSVHIVVRRDFVQFAIHNPKARQVLHALKSDKKTDNVPDEQFFATLNHNPEILVAPGAYRCVPETNDREYPFLPRLKNWFGEFPCKSKRSVRGICIWGIEDLPFIATRKELFINKFYEGFQPFALDCVEEWYWNRTRLDYEHGNHLYLDYYKSLNVVKNHI